VRRVAPKTDNQSRSDGLDLGDQPGLACDDFGATRFSDVSAAFLPF